MIEPGTDVDGVGTTVVLGAVVPDPDVVGVVELVELVVPGWWPGVVLVVGGPAGAVVLVVVDAACPVVVEVVPAPDPDAVDPFCWPAYPVGVGAGRTTR